MDLIKQTEDVKDDELVSLNGVVNVSTWRLESQHRVVCVLMALFVRCSFAT